LGGEKTKGRAEECPNSVNGKIHPDEGGDVEKEGRIGEKDR